MPEFLSLVTPQAARERWLSHLSPIKQLEIISVSQALGRVLAEEIYSPHPLPEFRRATVDGYALSAQASFGASDALPAYLNLIGEVNMGAAPDFSLPPQGCALIHTGGMLPEGADTVVMVELTQSVGNGVIEVFRPAAMGENTIQVGEDIAAGEHVISSGSILRPAEIGGLLALGITSVKVVRQPRVAICSSGDEVIPPAEQTKPGQVRDINAYTLSALVEHAGGIPVLFGIVPDDENVLLARCMEALAAGDMLVVTAGSSASSRDLTAKVFSALGEPGVLVHGVQLHPGKPTILGIADGKPTVGLPGNPVSALIAARLFVLPALERMSGVKPFPQPTLKAKLTMNVASQAGREDWLPVRLIADPDGMGMLAEPVFGRSNLIFTLVRADGLICIPLAANGLEPGQIVDVFMF